MTEEDEAPLAVWCVESLAWEDELGAGRERGVGRWYEPDSQVGDGLAAGAGVLLDGGLGDERGIAASDGDRKSVGLVGDDQVSLVGDGEAEGTLQERRRSGGGGGVANDAPGDRVERDGGEAVGGDLLTGRDERVLGSGRRRGMLRTGEV